MAWGGSIKINNQTSYSLKKLKQHSYQMKEWKFPDVIASKKEENIYVEYDNGPFKTVSDDRGSVIYEIPGLLEFKLEATCEREGFISLSVTKESKNVMVSPSGSMPFMHNGHVEFIIIEEK